MSSVEAIEGEVQRAGISSPAERPRISLALCLVVLALLVRLALFVHLYGIHFSRSAIVVDDSFTNETTNIAASIAGGRGFSSPMASVVDGDMGMGPSAWIAPVYPYFCALVFRFLDPFSPSSYAIILLVQCVISALTILPILRVAKLTTGMNSGYIASFLWAVFPWFSKWPLTWIWEVSLSAFLFTCLFWFALRLQEPAKLRTWIGFGALWGFALLVNPALMTLLPVSAVWIALRRSKLGRDWLKNGCLAAVVCLVVISPWLIRNRVVFGEWVFIRDNFGFEFDLGNFHHSTGRGWRLRHPTGSHKELKAYIDMGELNYVRYKTELARQFVRDYPQEFIQLTAKRILWFWDGSAVNYTMGIPEWWGPMSYGLFSILMVPSLLLACVKKVHGWPVFLGAILLYPIPYYLTYSQLRYRHVLEPLMLLLVVYASSQTIARFRSKPAEA